MLKLRLITSFLLLLTTMILNAQELEPGIFIGAANYQGDVADGVIVFKETKPSFGALLRYNLNSKWTIKASFYTGKISGKDANSKEEILKLRGYVFDSNIQEVAIQGEWNLTGRYMYDNMGEFRRFGTPFIGLGVGLTFATGKPKAPDRTDWVDNPFLYEVPFPEENDIDNFLCVPVTAGYKFHFLENFKCSFEVGVRTIFSDYLDGVSRNGNSQRDDWYSFGGITINYVFSEGADILHRKSRK